MYPTIARLIQPYVDAGWLFEFADDALPQLELRRDTCPFPETQYCVAVWTLCRLLRTLRPQLYYGSGTMSREEMVELADQHLVDSQHGKKSAGSTPAMFRHVIGPIRLRTPFYHQWCEADEPPLLGVAVLPVGGLPAPNAADPTVVIVDPAEIVAGFLDSSRDIAAWHAVCLLGLATSPAGERHFLLSQTWPDHTLALYPMLSIERLMGDRSEGPEYETVAASARRAQILVPYLEGPIPGRLIAIPDTAVYFDAETVKRLGPVNPLCRADCPVTYSN